MATKLRFSATPDSVEEETRYRLIDHTGNWWVRRKLSDYFYSYGKEIQSKDAWRENTSATPEEAFTDHMPALSPDYEVIPSDTVIVRVIIDLLSTGQEARALQYCAPHDIPPFNTKPQAGEYYAFTTIDDVQELFLYSDVKHISFKEF